MGSIGINLPQLVTDAATAHIDANVVTFKSDVPGPKGDIGDTGVDGDSLTLVSVVNNNDYTMTLTFSDGSEHITGAIRGQIGEGVDVDNVTFNTAGEMTLKFSDGTIVTSPTLKGQDGRNIHHIVHDSSQLPDGTVVPGIGRGDGLEDEVEYGVAGNKDTYIAYADEEEFTHVGEITLQNSNSAYQYAVDGGFTGTLEEFTTILGMIDDIVEAANNTVIAAEAARDKAEQWAEELEDVEVEAGKYSSLHWAAKAETDTLNALAVADLKVNIADIVDDLLSTAVDVPLSANQGRVLKVLIDNINLLLASDDTTLDELQEVVNFIKANRTDLDALTLDNIAETATNKWFTADDNTKLDGIEAAATADQTGAEIKIAYEAELDTNAYTDVEKALVDEATVLDTTATTLPSALNEVHGEVDTHVAATGAHGVTTVAGLDEVQTLTNKTLTDPSNYVHARRVEYQVKAATTEILKGAPVTINEWNVVGDVAEAVVTDQSITTQYGIANAVAAETIALGSVGTVIMSGTLIGLNTEAYAENQMLFVNGGTLTNVEPTSGWVQPIARVLRDHATEGVIQIQAQAPKQDAYGVRYDNSTSGMTAVHVQGALDELQVEVDTLASEGLTQIVQDTTPQLGGDLDLNTYQINGLLANTVEATVNGNVSNGSVQLMLEQIMNGSNPKEI